MDATMVKSVTVLGAGCRNCKKMLAATEEAMKELGLAVTPEYVTDMEGIMAYGIMQMPGLAVNGRVVSQGKVLSVSEVVSLISQC